MSKPADPPPCLLAWHKGRRMRELWALARGTAGAEWSPLMALYALLGVGTTLLVVGAGKRAAGSKLAGLQLD